MRCQAPAGIHLIDTAVQCFEHKRGELELVYNVWSQVCCTVVITRQSCDGSSTYPDGERTPRPHPVTTGDLEPASESIVPRRISSSWMALSGAGAAGSSRELVRLTDAPLKRRAPPGDASVKRVAWEMASSSPRWRSLPINFHGWHQSGQWRRQWLRTYNQPCFSYTVKCSSSFCGFCWYFSTACKFCINFYTKLLNNKIYPSSPGLVKIHMKMKKTLFQPRKPQFLQRVCIARTAERCTS